jgi:hypothetical protein
MGIDLNFGSETKLDFRYSYLYWTDIRKLIVESFFVYLKEWVPQNSFEDSWENYYYLEIIKLINEYDDKQFYCMNDYCDFFEKYTDCLACFGFLGVSVLIKRYKQGYQGYYSCGNSLDIYNLLKKIKKFIPKDDYKQTMHLKKIFKYSIDKKKPVNIS